MVAAPCLGGHPEPPGALIRRTVLGAGEFKISVLRAGKLVELTGTAE
jgi:hypothetical protein